MDDKLIINGDSFKKFIKKLSGSKEYKEDKKYGIKIEDRLKLWERCGLYIKYSDDNAIITNKLYPKMFKAMIKMANITLKEKASASNSFTYCDFRKLYKDYKYDKYENALVFLNDEQTEIARQFNSFANQNNFKLSLNGGHCKGYVVIYSYNKSTIMALDCLNNEILLNMDIPYDRNNLELINKFFKYIEEDSEELKKFFYKRIHRCTVCSPYCQKYSMRIFDRPNKVCHYWRNVLHLSFNLTITDVPFVEAILKYIIKYYNEILN